MEKVTWLAVEQKLVDVELAHLDKIKENGFQDFVATMFTQLVIADYSIANVRELSAVRA